MRSKFFAVLGAALLLTACSSGATEETNTPSADVTVASAYVKAAAGMMTGAFMDITNNTDADLTLTGATADFAERVEVHEVVEGVMRMKEGGLVIKAGETQQLMPGGNHLMFMGLTQPIAAGEELTFTLQFSDGSSVQVLAPAKDINMGDETYQPSSPMPSESTNM